VDRNERRQRIAAILAQHEEGAATLRTVIAACAAASPEELGAVWRDTFQARDAALAQVQAATRAAIRLLDELAARE
jgi:hypothetical protein